MAGISSQEDHSCSKLNVLTSQVVKNVISRYQLLNALWINSCSNPTLCYLAKNQNTRLMRKMKAIQSYFIYGWFPLRLQDFRAGMA